MKTFALLIALIMGMVINANGAVIHATMSEIDGNTMITCVPHGDEEIGKAYISLYVSDGQELFISRRKMEVSYDNVATYELPGTHDTIEGKCKFIFSAGDKKIARESFTISMK